MADNKFVIYRIYYGNEIVYVGRTTQKLQARLHGHFFKVPHMRQIDINRVSKIDFAELNTKSDLYLYEIYYINKHKPILNTDDKSKDELTIQLPELSFMEFTYYLMEKWKNEIYIRDGDFKRKKENQIRMEELQRKERMEKRNTLPHEEYIEWLDTRPRINFKVTNKDW